MKRIKFLIFTFLVLVLCGCEHMFDNYGYPKEVYIPKEGGSVEITKSCGFYQIDLHDYDYNFQESIIIKNDTVSCRLDWLTVVVNGGDGELNVIAEVNTSGKERSLYIDGAIMNSGPQIKVTQEK